MIEHVSVRRVFVLLAGMLVLASVSVTGQGGRVATAPRLPPLSMTCPMHPDVVESKPGTCPLCKMNLVPVRLDASWMCPVHAVVIEQHAGTCRLCARPLVPVVVALSWTCRGDVNADFLEPGLCRDGSPRIGKRTLRPHGNHNPQHGGQFFMAPDTWHHLEGTLPRDRLFRLHIYDDYARTLSGADLLVTKGRVVTRQRFDPTTRTNIEEQTFPLKLSRDRRSLEAAIARSTLPAAITVKVRFKPDQPEYRFDFTFRELTREPTAPTAPGAQQASSPTLANRTKAEPPVTKGGAPQNDSSATYSVPTEPISGSMAELLASLRQRREEVQALVQKGNFGAVWVPAFQAKDIAIALEPHAAHLQPRQRGLAEPAFADLVRAAWRLDAAGDTGNSEDVATALAAFTDAVSRLLQSFEAATP